MDRIKSSRARRNRNGWGLIGILIVVVIVGYLYSRQAATLLGPGRSSMPIPSPQNLPSQAAMDVFRLNATQIRAAAGLLEAQYGRKPQAFEDLAQAGVDVGMKDPWGGRYYLQNGWLRCTGNPQAAEQVSGD